MSATHESQMLQLKLRQLELLQEWIADTQREYDKAEPFQRAGYRRELRHLKINELAPLKCSIERLRRIRG